MMIPKFLSDRIAESIYAELHYQVWARKILSKRFEQSSVNAESVKSVTLKREIKK